MSKSRKPLTHIGIIMDGNRRFAKRLMKNPSKGHEWGAQKVSELLGWCQEAGIRELTLYSLSLENFNRPQHEFDFLMDLFRREFDKLKDDQRIYENKIRIRALGRVHLLPQDIQDKVHYIEEQTKHHTQYIINFTLGYGGRSEIVDAARKIAQEAQDGTLDPKDITEDTFPEYLYMKDEPDILIRTGGEHRISNFFPYQIAYAEFFFLDKMWPEFEKEDLLSIIEQYTNRERRFGR